MLAVVAEHALQVLSSGIHEITATASMDVHVDESGGKVQAAGIDDFGAGGNLLVAAGPT